MSTTTETITSAAVILAGSTLAGVLGYGTYGYLRDKGWSTWKAGAVTGLIGGGLGVAVALLGPKIGLSGIGKLPRAYPTPLRLVPKQVVGAAMRGICVGCQ